MRIETLACGDAESGHIPPDLEGTTYIADLCRKPGDLAKCLEGADRLVMILHRGDVSLSHIQQSVRSAGIDPLGIEYLWAEAIAGDARRAKVLLGGARARVAAYIESTPEHARPTFGGARSRREMLSVPQPHYEAVPFIDETACAAPNGCRACVIECPQSAYRWSAGRVAFDRDACVTCGRCVTICPTGAITNPTIGAEAVQAQIVALVEGAVPDPIGIAFVCRQRDRILSSGAWAEVEVPCTGMVPATWPIGALLLGAGSSAVVPCESSGCGLANSDRAVDAVATAGELLAAVGWQSSAVTTMPIDPAGNGRRPSNLQPAELKDPFGLHGPTEVALALAGTATVGPVTASGRMAGRGLVAINQASCTLCLTCVETCPTGALGSGDETGQVSVTFDAAQCTGCSQCVTVCPELDRGAIRVDHRIDTDALSAGRRLLNQSATADCELCGQPIASTAMLARIAAMLGDEHDATMSYVERRCMDCRGAT